MMTSRMPVASVRVTTKNAGQKLVAKELITQAELDAVFKQPALNDAEIARAKKLVGRMRAAIELAGKKRSADVDRFDTALNIEASAARRVAAAQTALSEGVIDTAAFQSLTRARPGLLAGLTILRHGTKLDEEVNRLAKIIAGADDTQRPSLAAALARVTHQRDVVNALADTMPNDLPDDAITAGCIAVGAILGLVFCFSHTNVPEPSIMAWCKYAALALSSAAAGGAVVGYWSKLAIEGAANYRQAQKIS
jgi:hypothetical protein